MQCTTGRYWGPLLYIQSRKRGKEGSQSHFGDYHFPPFARIGGWQLSLTSSCSLNQPSLSKLLGWPQILRGTFLNLHLLPYLIHESLPSSGVLPGPPPVPLTVLLLPYGYTFSFCKPFFAIISQDSVSFLTPRLL